MIHNVHINFNKEPKTLGVLAERKTKKMSKAEREEYAMKCKTPGGWDGKMPKGGSLPEKSAKRPEWRPDRDTADMSLIDYTAVEKHKFIMEGKTPIGK